MAYFVFKTIISALIIAIVSEVSKRLPWMGALVASLPLTSILAMIWLYRDTRDLGQVSKLSSGILILVLPSLVLFSLFPLLVKRGFGFAAAMGWGSVATAAVYLIFWRAFR